MELLVYMAILSVIVVILANSFLSLVRGRNQISGRGEVSSALRFAAAKINQDIKSASSVGIPASMNATSSSLQVVSDGVTITYDVSGGQLRRNIGGGPEAITSSLVTITNLVFTRLENFNHVLSATTTSIETNISMSTINTGSESLYSGSVKSTAALRQ